MVPFTCFVLAEAYPPHRNASESLRNVVLTTAAKERDATKKVFQCFLDALTMISETPYQDRQRICVEGNGNVAGVSLAIGRGATRSSTDRVTLFPADCPWRYRGSLPGPNQPIRRCSTAEPRYQHPAYWFRDAVDEHRSLRESH